MEASKCHPAAGISSKEKVKLMNILKANFDDYNWEEDDSGNIE